MSLASVYLKNIKSASPVQMEQRQGTLILFIWTLTKTKQIF